MRLKYLFYILALLCSINPAREVRKGMTENVLEGLHTGSTGALDYNVDQDTKKYTINEREAEAVRMIFRMSIKGTDMVSSKHLYFAN